MQLAFPDKNKKYSESGYADKLAILFEAFPNILLKQL